MGVASQRAPLSGLARPLCMSICVMKRTERWRDQKMRSNGFLKKIASGVLAAGFLVGIGMAGGSTASAADRRYDNHDQYHSSDFRDGRDRDRRDRDNRFHRADRDDWYWVRD